VDEEAGPRHTGVMCDLVGLHLGLEPRLVRAPDGHWMLMGICAADQWAGTNDAGNCKTKRLEWLLEK
jgi:hypothetical protein